MAPSLSRWSFTAGSNVFSSSILLLEEATWTLLIGASRSTASSTGRAAPPPSVPGRPPYTSPAGPLASAEPTTSAATSKRSMP